MQPIPWRALTSLGAWSLVSIGVVFPLAALAQLAGWTPNPIHDYADAAACQLGGREDRYLPAGVGPPRIGNVLVPYKPWGSGGAFQPAIASAARIPITWNLREVRWFPADLNNGTGEYKVNMVRRDPASTGTPACNVDNAPDGCFVSMAVDFPEQGADGPFRSPTTNASSVNGNPLKCDYFPYVSPSCTPDQYAREIVQGGRCTDGAKAGASCSIDDECPDASCGGPVRWQILFRRNKAPALNRDNDPALNAKAWNRAVGDPLYGTHVLFYDVVDANALKTDTYGAVWLDGLGVADPTDGTFHTASRDFDNGFRAGPMPRPGGKRPEWRLEGGRASKWFDTPAAMKGPGAVGQCTNCHGTPFNGSDWLAQVHPQVRFRNNNAVFPQPDDDELPFWHAGNEVLNFNETFFIDRARSAAGNSTCGGCHRQWMIRSASTPGNSFGTGAGIFARHMTMVHDNAVAGNPFGPIAYRIASRYRKGNPITPPFDTVNLAYLDRNATQTHWMPPKHGAGTVAFWNGQFQSTYNLLACCGTANAAGVPTLANAAFTDGPNACAGVTCTYGGGAPVKASDAKPDFYTPWMKANGKTPDAAIAPTSQLIDAPDAPVNTSLTLIDCPAGIVPPNPKDKCYRLAWDDPAGSAFNAPMQYYLAKLANKKVRDPDWTDAERSATAYCSPGTPPTQTPVAPAPTSTQIPGQPADSKWRFSYTSVGVLPHCEKMIVRLCGGWCGQNLALNRDPNTRLGTQVATDAGQFLTLANDTFSDVTASIAIVRSGFRKNLTTGRYVQTLQLTNTTAAAIHSPILIVLLNLSANATLYNKSGDTNGRPYLSLAVGGDSLVLAPGQTASAVLEFTNPSNQGITYGTQTLAGTVSADCNCPLCQ